MLEKLLQAIAITVLLALLAGIGMPKPKETSSPLFHALFSFPMREWGSIN
ncbi:MULTISPECIES: hypothetical protein [Leptolyngbya]|jgi:hypothetical protein|uniref:Uncharacterized protein n=2 Tax=Leptolyngbya boryana TaxID=1184 RepID=A0A1Z4JML8_LEPBY|nr:MULTISPECIES: hypothetical protein [Leptolyngbya]BAY57992.1 hypothetical protein NIES2135_48650 [Leptolyngbya boryana NIES-2135]MBD1856245.1 hypothetical protein [Leptolyngbya sp. FACHB-1624]MBD2367436.1 hypothetical protein [Leptolyngbya sp. FACHB-161]MBD2373960.1 hypothetical protein [Leptolyngbya sp. FACHB-238]MBD2398240.1 hypothetical protein [Leptolyngbya sp. FACHB-239]